jgi:dihydroxyacid dehydratase/phosphogluconate dehydratase
MYTANTMASSIEALGMSLPYSSSIPATDPLKLDECRMAGRCAVLRFLCFRGSSYATVWQQSSQLAHVHMG